MKAMCRFAKLPDFCDLHGEVVRIVASPRRTGPVQARVEQTSRWMSVLGTPASVSVRHCSWCVNAHHHADHD